MSHLPPATPKPQHRGVTLRHVAGLLPSLVASESRVATAILAACEPPGEWSVAALAAASDTSPATVVRTCQSLGFTGFNQLRDVLVAEAQVPTRRVPGGEGDAVEAVRRTLAAGSEQIENMHAMLDAGALEQAVAGLADASRVLVVTLSDLALLGQYALFRFAMIGRPVEAPIDVIALHAVAAQLGPGDVCLAVGHSGTNALTVRIAGAARAAGAMVIAVTSFARGPLAEAADVHLAVGSVDPRGSVHDQTRIRVGQMLMVDALQNAVALRLDTRQASSTMLRTLSSYVHHR